jgi:hypothetical protein
MAARRGEAVMRRAAKVDRNQAQIVEALRAVGASVQPIHAIGSGCPDLLVGRLGRSYVLEVKDGAKPPSARKLTPDEQRWFAAWKGHAVVVESVADALRAIGIDIASDGDSEIDKRKYSIKREGC